MYNYPFYAQTMNPAQATDIGGSLPTTYPTPAAVQAHPSPAARANVPAAGGAWPQAWATPMAAVQSPWQGGYPYPVNGAGATVQNAWGAGATPLGAQGPSFAGPGVQQVPQGAGATPLGAQGPSFAGQGVQQVPQGAGDVQSQLALMNQRLNSFLGQAGNPGAAPLEGHEWMASIIAPPPENPNNYLGGLVNGGK